MPRATTHECPKNGCLAQVPRSMLACREHWAQVSRPAQRELYASYRSDNLGRHVAAMQDCIDELNGGEPRVSGPVETVELPGRRHGHDDCPDGPGGHEDYCLNGRQE